MKKTSIIKTIFLFTVLFFINFFCLFRNLYAMPSYDDVLVVYRTPESSYPDSKTAAYYFKEKRGVPDKNMLGTPGNNRDIMLQNISNKLAELGEGKINYIVLSCNFPRLVPNTETPGFNSILDLWLTCKLAKPGINILQFNPYHYALRDIYYNRENAAFSYNRYGFHIISRFPDELGLAKQMIDNSGAEAYSVVDQLKAGELNYLLYSDTQGLANTLHAQNLKERGLNFIYQNSDTHGHVRDVDNILIGYFNWAFGPSGGLTLEISSFPTVCHNLTFAKGSLLEILRSFPLANLKRYYGGLGSINIDGTNPTSYRVYEDYPIRHQSYINIDKLNNVVYVGSGVPYWDISYSGGDRLYRNTERAQGNGVAVYDRNTGALLEILSPDNSGLLDGRVTKIEYDRFNNKMYFLCYDGVVVRDLTSGNWSTITELSCENAVPYDIYVDPYTEGRKIYVVYYYDNTTYSGGLSRSSQMQGAHNTVYEYDIVTKTLTKYQLQTFYFPSITKTSQNTLWLCGQSGRYTTVNRLYKYDLSTKSIVKIFDLSNLDGIGYNAKTPVEITSGELEGTSYVYVPQKVSSDNSFYGFLRIADLPGQDYTITRFGSGSLPYFDSSASKYREPYKVFIDDNQPEIAYLFYSNIWGAIVRVNMQENTADMILDGKRANTGYVGRNLRDGVLDPDNGKVWLVHSWNAGHQHAVDFIYYGASAVEGGMSHDTYRYGREWIYFGLTPEYRNKILFPGYSETIYSYPVFDGSFSNSADVQCMAIYYLDGFSLGESRYLIHTFFPHMGGLGLISHMPAFDPKTNPFAPRVHNDYITGTTIADTYNQIVVKLISPGMVKSDFLESTINRDTVKLKDNNGKRIPASFITWDSENGKIRFTALEQLENLKHYSLILSCGVGGIKNSQGAPLINTRPDEHSNEIVLSYFVDRTGSDNNPPIANDDSVIMDEDTTVVIDVLGNDSDVDEGTLTIESVSPAQFGAVINNGNNITYTPNKNFFGGDNFTYLITDSRGGTDIAYVMVTVKGVEDSPTINVVSEQSVMAGNLLTFEVLAEDPDGDNLTYLADNLPSGASFDVNTPIFSWIPPLSATGKTYPVLFSVSDGKSTVSEVVNITVISPLSISKKTIIDDWSGRTFMVNGDRRFNPGERIELQMELKNLSSQSILDVSATLTTDNPYITILDDEVEFGNIPAYTAIMSLDNFLIEASSDTPDNHKVIFILDISSSDRLHIGQEEFEITIAHRFSGPRKGNIQLYTTTTGDVGSYNPQITSDGNGNIYVVWGDSRNSDRCGDIYFNYSTDFGGTWQEEDIRLDTDEPGSANSYEPQISCDNNGGVYVVWGDSRNGTSDIYFNYSRDYGATWQKEDIRLNTDEPRTTASYSPQINCDDNGGVYVVWQKGVSYFDIYFNYSTDYGVTWQEEDIRLDTDEAGTADSYWPDIDCDNNGGVYVVWGDSRNGAFDIYFNYSTDHGATWQTRDIRLDTDGPGAERSFDPQITSDNNGGVYVVWRDYRNGESDIYFNYSRDFGATWQPQDIRLDTDTPGAERSADPRITCDNNGGVYVVWEDWRSGQWGDIYFNYSTDHGATWLQDYGQTDMRLNTNEVGTAVSGDPQISCNNNGHVYVVWGKRDMEMEGQGEGPNQNESTGIYFNYSIDSGATWQEEDIKLDTDEPGAANSRSPQVKCDNNGNVYVVWETNRDAERNIYFTPIYIAEDTPYLNPVLDQQIEEDSLLEFVVTATNKQGAELELFLDLQGLPQNLQDNLSTATFETSFEATGETTGTYRWTPDSSSAGTYYPVVFVARDALGRCAYQAITIKVLDVILPGESIQEAIDRAQPDDIIYISAGEYNENIILKEGVSLVSFGKGPVIVNGKVKLLDNSSIKGITFNYNMPNGEKDPNFNYSMLHINSSDVTVKDCNFNLSYNSTTPLYYYTSIASISGDNIALEGNTFTFTSSNSYYYIYGLRIGLQTQTSNITLKGNTIDIEDTTPSRMYYIYGVYAYRTDNLTFENNIINTKSKTARYGLYGLMCYSSNGIGDNITVKNNTIYLKTDSPNPYNITGIYTYQVPHLTIRNNIIDLLDGERTSYPKPVYIYGYYTSTDTSTGTSTSTSTNTDTDTDTDTSADIKVTYNIYDKTNTFIYKYPSSLPITEHNNIKADPEFKDPQDKDFHLLLNSPAIDRGDPHDEYTNEPYPNGYRINCGSYGNTPEATITPRIINVPQDYPTIQSAINASDYGTIIYLKEGTYNENITLKNGIYLIGQGRDKTTVNGKINIGSDSLIKGITFSYNIPDSNPHTLANIQASNTIVRDSNFNLTYNGSSYMSYNNYIAYLQGDDITLENNTFSFTTSNAYFYTRGIYGSLCTNATLKNNRIDIIDNSPLRGYYVYPVSLMHPQNLVFENNIIYAKANNAYGIYGLTLTTSNGMYDNALIKNNTIYLKTNRIAGVYYLTGIYTSGLAKLNIRSNIIDLPDGYRTTYPRSIYIYGSGLSVPLDIKTTYNIYNGTDTFIYKYPSTIPVTEHDNIKADPQFINPQAGDFHLFLTSPAIDKGDPKDPYYLEPKPNGSRVNCGSYGNTKEATTSP